MSLAKSVLCLFGRKWANAKGSSKAAKRNRRSLRAEFLENRYLLSAGDLDPTFGIDGGVNVDWNSSEEAHAVAIAPDGKIVVAGWTNSGSMTGGQDIAVARVLPDGSLDPSFSDDGRLTTDLNRNSDKHNVARDVVIQPDGKILVAGAGLYDFLMVRYNDDGSLDNGFGRKGQVLTNFVGKGQNTSGEIANAVALRPDGRIVLAGLSNLPGLTGGSDAIALAQYLPDGSLDTTFGEDLNEDGTPDGKVVDEAATLHTDGYQVTATSMALDAAGGIVVAGSIVTADHEIAHAFVTRYEADGTHDSDFGLVILNREIDHSYTGDLFDGTVIQPDGKIVVAFTGGGGIQNDRYLALARLLPDGQFDPDFGLNGIQEFPDLYVWQVSKLALQSDGKIVTCGERDGFVATRHLPDGSLDASFGTGGMAALGRTNGEEARDVAIQTDGRIVLVGETMYDRETGYTQDRDFRVVRLEGDPVVPEPGITVNPVSGLVTTEDGGTDTFTVVLDSEPTDNVVIGISSSDPAKGTVDKDSLTFTPFDWDVPQTVTVTGVDDDGTIDGDVPYTIFTAAATGAAEYVGIDPADVSVTNLDNDSQTQPHVFYSMDTPLAIADAHPKKGDKTTTSRLDATTHDAIQSLVLEVSLDDGMTDVSDLRDMELTSPVGTSVTITPVSGISTVDLSTEFDGDDPYGIWTLAITDFVKGNIHVLNQWSLTLNEPAQAAAAAADLALLAWLPSDSSDDDIDSLATQAADDLALLIME